MDPVIDNKKLQEDQPQQPQKPELLKDRVLNNKTATPRIGKTIRGPWHPIITFMTGAAVMALAFAGMSLYTNGTLGSMMASASTKWDAVWDGFGDVQWGGNQLDVIPPIEPVVETPSSVIKAVAESPPTTINGIPIAKTFPIESDKVPTNITITMTEELEERLAAIESYQRTTRQLISEAQSGEVGTIDNLQTRIVASGVFKYYWIRARQLDRSMPKWEDFKER